MESTIVLDNGGRKALWGGRSEYRGCPEVDIGSVAPKSKFLHPFHRETKLPSRGEVSWGKGGNTLIGGTGTKIRTAPGNQITT